MTTSIDDGTHDPPQRDTYRVPIGLPLRGEQRARGAVVSLLLHLLALALLIAPVVLARNALVRMPQGAGGNGPAGGGGGGAGAMGDDYRENLRYVRLIPTPVPTPTSIPPISPPVVPPVVVPVVPPATVAPPARDVPAPEQPAGAGVGGTTVGSGGEGAGPGSGGGTGSGTGIGRGSGVGPGTGGGTQANYPPQPIEFFLPPLPAPSSVRGFQFLAEFDVDSTGKVLDMQFTPSRDGDYNRRLAGVLRSLRFRPGTRPDGTPLRMKAQVAYQF